MNKSKHVISIIIGFYLVFEISSNLRRIEISLRDVGNEVFLREYLSGFWFVIVLVIVILSFFILQNLLSLIFSFIYGEQSDEENRVVRISQKIMDVLKVFYRIVVITMFGVIDIIGLFLPGVEGRDATVYIVCGVFLVAVVVMLVFSIRSMVRIIRN